MGRPQLRWGEQSLSPCNLLSERAEWHKGKHSVRLTFRSVQWNELIHLYMPTLMLLWVEEISANK
eukprot:8027539-Pyramimonas_sp.AAC.1